MIWRTAKEVWPLSDGRGNHRIIVHATQAAEYVKVQIHWRRRDIVPENCGILAYRLEDDRIVNAASVIVTRQYGEIVFEAPTAGEYALYYMPFQSLTGSWWFPTLDYSHTQFSSSTSEWKENIQTEMLDAEVIAIESRTDFDSFYPMEVPSDETERKELLAKHSDAEFLVFPESREYPVRMLRELPYRWIEMGVRDSFFGEARPDEHYVFQLGIYAIAKLSEIQVTYENFSGNISLSADAVTCYNIEGTDWLGKRSVKDISCEAGNIQALWFGVQLPPDLLGSANFDVIIHTTCGKQTVRVSLDVRGENIDNHGDGELWRLSRLRWLNSTIGLDDEAAKPFTPVKHCAGEIDCLGRRTTLNESGFPAAITSFFDKSIRVSDISTPILREPVTFQLIHADGPLFFSNFQREEILSASGVYSCQTTAHIGGVALKNESRFEYDGHIETLVTITSETDLDLEDIILNIALTPACSTYMMGMGRAGGLSPECWDYEWNPDRANNYVWIGGVNGGLHLKLKHTEEVWEMYNYQKTGLPESWYNAGKGSCHIEFTPEGATLQSHSGMMRLKAGKPMTFRYSLQITPIKELNSDAHWRERYDHPGDKGVDLYAAKEGGATVVNLHQGRDLNPYINYPFCHDDVLKPEIEEAHALGIKYKLYYTVRELTTHAQEFWAVRSLNNEILLDGPSFRVAEHFKEDFFEQEGSLKSTGGPWLCEHLPEGYTPAWQTLLSDGDFDCSVATVGLSRWHNYYLEGLSWLVRETGADGIYLDGVGYDRQIMKRVRKVMDVSKEGCLIDFHSGNNFHPEYGLNNVLGTYMELLPSVDSLWIGEGFDYETSSPDYWLVEISGIPFGLMGDMLHGGGNKWRGMVFGMTPRCNWPQGGSPLPIWQLWEKFGMEGCSVLGWWNENCPVTLSHPDCRATVYMQKNRALISIASWAKEAVEVFVTFHSPLNMDGSTCQIPQIENFQQEQVYKAEKPLLIQPGEGKILLWK